MLDLFEKDVLFLIGRLRFSPHGFAERTRASLALRQQPRCHHRGPFRDDAARFGWKMERRIIHSSKAASPLLDSIRLAASVVLRFLSLQDAHEAKEKAIRVAAYGVTLYNHSYTEYSVKPIIATKLVSRYSLHH